MKISSISEVGSFFMIDTVMVRETYQLIIVNQSTITKQLAHSVTFLQDKGSRALVIKRPKRYTPNTCFGCVNIQTFKHKISYCVFHFDLAFEIYLK